MLGTESSAARADSLVRRSHERAYRYPRQFEGFRAQVAWRTDDASGTGGVLATSGAEVDIARESGDEAPDWVARELRSIVGHRRFSEYDHGDGAHEKRLGETGHVLGEVVELGDPLESSYRVAGDEISTVTRTMGGRRFTIVVHDRLVVPDGRAVPISFTVFYWDAESGALAATEAYRDEVVDVDGVFLPRSRRVVRGDDGGISVREVELDAHELLAVAAAR